MKFIRKSVLFFKSVSVCAKKLQTLLMIYMSHYCNLYSPAIQTLCTSVNIRTNLMHAKYINTQSLIYHTHTHAITHFFMLPKQFQILFCTHCIIHAIRLNFVFNNRHSQVHTKLCLSFLFNGFVIIFVSIKYKSRITTRHNI